MPLSADQGNTFFFPFLWKIFNSTFRYTLVKADYSQMEMRILAQVSGDDYLLHFFAEGKDIHTLIAGHMFGNVFLSFF